MEVSNAHHHQTMASQVLEDGAMASGSAQQEHEQDQNMMKRVMKPNNLELRCPRCDSGNTKFCYYNNHSLSQPRHFCKACRRYWTQGGSLRNIPVGGGCRRKTNNNNNKRSSSSKKLSTNLQYQDSSSNNNTFLVPSLNPSNPAAALLDLLRSTGLPADSSNNAGPNYGFGGGLMIMPLPFDGGLILNSTEAVTTTTAAAAAAAAASTGRADQLMVVHQQWPAYVGGWGDHAATANDLGVLVDPMLIRDNYWNGTVGPSSSSSWHGLNQHLSYVE